MAATTRRKAQTERQANVTWEGGLTEGSGTIERTTSGAVSGLPVSWPARTDEPGGKTSPEELLAASHAACYAMALSYELQGRNAPPERLAVSATIGFDPKVGGGFEVSFSHLSVSGRVPGLDQAVFAEAAKQAEQGCPISNAIRNSVQISLEAALEPAVG